MSGVVQRRRAWREWLRDAFRSPLGWILLVVALLHVPGITWGLPASDGWDNDGVAPRDFLAGLVETFTPGHFYTYPPVHLVILGVASVPTVAVALLRAASVSQADIVNEILQVPYMTVIAVIARTVTMLMSLGIVIHLSTAARAVFGRRASYLVALMVGVNATFAYYAQTTNLDVPYLFWATWSLSTLMRAMTRYEPRRVVRAVILAVLAVGTKDQAYAMFVLVPVPVLAWILTDHALRGHRHLWWRAIACALPIAFVTLLVADAIVLNPSGFLARLHFLTGPASRDFAHYSADAAGRWLVIQDVFSRFDQYYPAWVLAFVVFGVGASVVSKRRAIAILPLVAAVSFTLFFNCVARRTEGRFLLPQMLIFGFYAGLGLDALGRLLESRSRPLRMIAPALSGATAASCIFMCATVNANMVLDPRYDAEAWLRQHVAPDAPIETYGLNVYLPRFSPTARVSRVGPKRGRNPMPGVVEVQDAFGNAEARGARFLVVSEGWVWRYLLDPKMKWEPGRILPPTQVSTGSDPDGSQFFQSLVRGQLRYRQVHASKWSSDFWPRLDIHASTAREIWIFERI